MNTPSILCVCLLSVAAAACGSSDPSSEPADSSEPVSESTVSSDVPAAEASGEVTTIAPMETLADQLAGRWYPVAVDGTAIDPGEGDFWSFRGTDTAFGISGYDGCNNFSTVGNPDQESATIVDGRFDILDMMAEEAGCDEGAFSGPYPEVGALLTISDDGTTLISDGPSGTVELSRNAPAPPVSTELPPPPAPGVGTFQISPPNPQPGTNFEATFDPDNERGGYFTLERWSGSEWLDAAFLLESDANGGSPTWAPIDAEFEVLDYGVSGPGPDGLVMPDVIDAGIWRLCTANAAEDGCTHMRVAR